MTFLLSGLKTNPSGKRLNGRRISAPIQIAQLDAVSQSLDDVGAESAARKFRFVAVGDFIAICARWMRSNSQQNSEESSIMYGSHPKSGEGRLGTDPGIGRTAASF